MKAGLVIPRILKLGGRLFEVCRPSSMRSLVLWITFEEGVRLLAQVSSLGLLPRRAITPKSTSFKIYVTKCLMVNPYATDHICLAAP